MDEALYRFFSNKFDKAVEDFGRERMHVEVANLRSRIDFWLRRCAWALGNSAPVAVFEYVEKRHNTSTEGAICHWLSLPEQAFAWEVRDRVLMACPQTLNVQTSILEVSRRRRAHRPIMGV